MSITTCIFDAYGTLFDVDAAARRAAQEPGGAPLREVWPKIAQDWRAKQLSYSWLRSLMHRHVDFWQITEDSLDWALEASEITAPGIRARLLALYRELDCFPDAPGTLRTLRERRYATAILSNGSPEMLSSATASANLDAMLDAVMSAEAVGIFKPDPRVYALALDRMGCRREDVLFVSSNGWDVAGAATFGFTTAWVNRTGAPVEHLPDTPGYILSDLAQLLEIVS